MKGRFQRGKIGGISPFFAFQDTITSALAVLIAIVMLLALDMGDGSPRESTPSRLTQRLKGLLDELSQANDALRMAQDGAATAKLNPEVLKGEVEALGRELANLPVQNRAAEKWLEEAQRQDSAAIVRSEIEKQKAAVVARAKALAQREEEAARSLAEMQRAGEELRARETQLRAQQARTNDLWLVPDRSKTSKEPILAVVTEDTVILQRFDRPEITEIRGWLQSGKFERALESYSKLDQYIVFYFKPSGAGRFSKLTSLARSAGFEIGYDVVDEGVEIHFGATR